MSILFKDFFPFPIPDYSSAPVFPAPTDRGTIVSSYALSELTKLFWLAKTFDYSVNISYADHAPPTRTGTLTGSGTVDIMTIDDIEQSISVAPILPAKRTLRSLSLLPTGAAYLTSEITDSYDGGVNNFYLQWFDPFDQSEISPNASVFKDGSNFKTLFTFEVGFGLLKVSSATTSGISSSVNLTLKVKDQPDLVFPLSIFGYVPPGIATPTASGSVIIDFNNFWPE